MSLQKRLHDLVQIRLIMAYSLIMVKQYTLKSPHGEAGEYEVRLDVHNL